MGLLFDEPCDLITMDMMSKRKFSSQEHDFSIWHAGGQQSSY